MSHAGNQTATFFLSHVMVRQESEADTHTPIQSALILKVSGDSGAARLGPVTQWRPLPVKTRSAASRRRDLPAFPHLKDRSQRVTDLQEE